jgi:hypothetical protein
VTAPPPSRAALECVSAECLTEGSGLLQDLFKCKPAIMRAFQAARGVHKVLSMTKLVRLDIG